MASFRDAHDARHRRASASDEGHADVRARIIATGSRPATIPGLSIDSPRVMDSTGALDLPDIPKSLLVVGGGYIGLELGTVYAALGSKVTVVEMTAGLLPGADRDLVNILAKRIDAICEAVLLNTKVVGDEGGRRTASSSRSKARAEHRASRRSTACWSRSAAGRTPPCPGSTSGEGRIGAASSSSTRAAARASRPSTPSATSPASRCSRTRRRTKARAAVDAIAGDRNVAFEPLAIPAVVFTDPGDRLGGLTETEAEKQGARSPSRASRGARRAARSRSAAPTASPSWSSTRRPTACSASASSAPAPAS